MPRYFEFTKEDVLTWPNLITVCRMLLAPIFLILFLNGHTTAAFIVFAIAASTDWCDGQLARKTNSVSKLGKMLDPVVDRLLILVAVIALLVSGRLPLWAFVLLISRDLILLIGGAILMNYYDSRIDVVYVGKCATASLSVAFCMLILNFPQIDGLGWTSISWLPGFNAATVSFGIWFLYLGIIFSLTAFVIYIVKGIKLRNKLRAKMNS